MITMTDAEALELQDFLNTSKAHIEALAEASAGWQARAEAAEATLASCNRARQAAEAECERLREQVAQAKVDGANEEHSLHWMSENMEIAALRKQVATLEIDHEKLLAMVVDLQDDYSNALKGAYIAEAKVSDLNEQVASLSHTNAVMAGDYGECQQEVECLREQVAALARQSASHDFLSDAKDEIWELFVAVRDDFDGSEYQQGKKDGLHSALALLGTPEMIAFNREGGMANAANTSQDAR